MSKVFTILICVVALAAIVFLCIYEPLTKSTREQAEATRAGRVLALDPNGVKEIRISTSGEEIELKRRGENWIMGPKPKDRADRAMVEAVLDTASGLTFLDRMDAGEFPKNDDLNEFGLKSPKRKIEFRGEQNLTLFLGKDAANEDRLYVRTSESKDVFLVPDAILKAAFPEGGKFRDRRLTDLQPDQIDRLVVRQPQGEVEFVHDARGWRMVKPLNASADGKAMSAYLDKLLGLPIREFVADDSVDLSAYGLTEGKNEISFFAEGSSRPQTLRLGSEKDGSLYAQFTARDSIYRIGPEVQELLVVSPERFRDRRLLPLNLDLVDLIRITSPQAQFSLRRAGNGWEVVDPSGSHPARESALQAMNEALSTTQATSYTPALGDKIAALGLATPSLAIDFLSVLSENTPETTAGENHIARIVFGPPQAGQVSARVDDLPEIASVPADILKSLPTDPKAWQAP